MPSDNIHRSLEQSMHNFRLSLQKYRNNVHCQLFRTLCKLLSKQIQTKSAKIIHYNRWFNVNYHTRCKKEFKPTWSKIMAHARLSGRFCFIAFKITIFSTNLNIYHEQINCTDTIQDFSFKLTSAKCPKWFIFNVRCLDSIPQPFIYESHPITTRSNVISCISLIFGWVIWAKYLKITV